MSHPPARPHADDFASARNLPVEWADPLRAKAFARWLALITDAQGLEPASLRIASADASFRRYLRVDSAFGSRIIMDAPPVLEDARPFVKVATMMAAAGIRVPAVMAWDEENGFLLLSDLGRTTMMQALERDAPHANLGLYLKAIEALVQWQSASRPEFLPVHDAPTMRRELELFAQWYVERHRGIRVEGALRKTLDQAFDTIIHECQAWPRVYVHNDFMPRNLMMPHGMGDDGQAEERLGVLDFQDAVDGPITLDIASLMRDAFLSWEEEFVIDVTVRYWEKARAAGLPVGGDFGAFYRGVEWTGLQRHLRIAGTFARLTLRDGKPQYLADTPRFIHYIRSTAARYSGLRPLLRLLDAIEGVQAQSGYAIGRM